MLLMSRHRWFVTLAASLLSLPLLAQTPDQVPPDLAAYVARVREQFHVPGIAIAIVKDGQVVLEQGYGERNLVDRKAVDAHTLFCIASNTKSFTATAIEMLADQGKLKLDDRVTDHLPWFHMANAYATQDLRVRDLLAHRSGLGPHGGDLLFVPESGYSGREVVERLANLPPASGFRDGFAYENIMFAVATLVIEQASGQSYAQFVREHMFTPMNMHESHINAAELKPGDNVVTAYIPHDEDGELGAVAPIVWNNAAGAAGIYSTAHDMAKWVQVQLAAGQLAHGGRLFSAQAQQRMWSMITPIDIDTPAVPQLAAATPSFFGYAEGWFLSDYRGQRTVWHPGGFPGTVSLVTLVPSMHLGIVVLTNQESEDAFNAITLHILDSYMHAPSTDWIAAYADAARLKAARAGDVAPWLHPPAHVELSLPLTKYAGRYNDAWYGDVVIDRIGSALRIRFTKTPRLVGSLIPWDHDTFLVHWDDRQLHADAFIDFTVDPPTGVREARMRRASTHVAPAYDYQDLRLRPLAPATP